jgi:hypothetical protein
MKKKKFEVVVSMNSYHTYIVEATDEDEAYEAVVSGFGDLVVTEPQDDPCLEEVNPIEG